MLLRVWLGDDLHVHFGAFQESKAAPTPQCVMQRYGRVRGALPDLVKRCTLLLMSEALGVRRQGFKSYLAQPLCGLGQLPLPLQVSIFSSIKQRFSKQVQKPTMKSVLANGSKPSATADV